MSNKLAHSDGHYFYQQRLQKVIDYIYDHLEQPLDLNRLADIACLSPYHWHRVYRAIYGETLAQTVKRLRLHKAAGLLTRTSLTISQIAKQSGYSGVPAFNRAFSDVYGLPPAAYRQQGRLCQFQLAANDNSLKDNRMSDVTLTRIEDFHILAKHHQGSYMNIGNAFEKIYGFLGAKGLLDPSKRTVGIYFNDPNIVPEPDLRSAAAVEFEQVLDIELAEGFEWLQIQGGEYAVLRYTGPYADMSSAYNYLYGVWLPESGREPADAPCFEHYLNNPRETAPSELITDIYLPLS